VQAPSDLRLLRRDWILLVLVFGLPFAALLLRWFLPLASELVSEWVDLELYYGLIVAGLIVSNQPVFLGVVIGLLFIEEREEGTLLALQASPISLRGFLGYRMLAATLISFVLTPIDVLLMNVVSVSWFELLAASALASIAVPLVALAYAVFIRNKVQGLIALRPVQTWAAAGALLYFVPTPWQWIGSIPSPLYYPMRLFWSAADGRPEWWLIGPGVILLGGAVLWLFRRFEHSVYA
jgi:fluoroquinolone transport system permease protein